MDRLQFSKSIGVNQELQIKEYFNEIMGMYNLFGEYENISVQGTVSGEVISFNLVFKSDDEDAKSLARAIDNVLIRIYGVLYRIKATSDGKTATVHLEEEPTN